VLREQREHAARLDQVPSDGLGIKQLTLIKRTTLHTHIVPPLKTDERDDTRCSAVS
jgi:hypothetical protein